MVPAHQWEIFIKESPMRRPGEDTLPDAKEATPWPTIARMDHVPLVFNKGEFSHAQTRWTTIEQETFALNETLTKLQTLMWERRGIVAFTEHQRADFLLGQEHSPGLTPVVQDNLHPGSLLTPRVPYQVIFINGDNEQQNNNFSRWGCSPSSNGNEHDRKDDHDALPPEHSSGKDVGGHLNGRGHLRSQEDTSAGGHLKEGEDRAKGHLFSDAAERVRALVQMLPPSPEDEVIMPHLADFKRTQKPHRPYPQLETDSATTVSYAGTERTRKLSRLTMTHYGHQRTPATSSPAFVW
eukprot:GHVU01169363.1.p1 GENE.GHVU01169363.1~~GHVU01169363.1.p1  ORF type:complete len:322 (+),score=38.65 GHVU01169363.1:82-966(+)